MYSSTICPSEPEFAMESGAIPLFTVIADINSVQGSDAKSISYQKFDWQIENSNSGNADCTDCVDFVPAPSLFNEQLALIPPETSTRVVLVVRPPAYEDDSSDTESINYSACRTTHEILRTAYKVGIKSGLGPHEFDAMIPQLGFFFHAP
ncbi:hypothetical protein EAF00_006044 [Botryotinia globosa]|nr:hypothetical protein EAF00_006044 [Botryotinia globosa]